MIALAGVGQWTAAEHSADARMAAQVASRLAAAQARELADLRAQLLRVQPVASQAPALQPTAAVATRAVSKPQRAHVTRLHPGAATKLHAHASEAVPDLDLDADDRDPIKGL